MDIFEIYADNIRRFRKAKEISQAELAEKIGLSVKFVSDLETGRSSGSLDTLISLAVAFEIEPYELLMPQNQKMGYDTRRTKQLLSRMRDMYSDFVDTLENFLAEG